jgi:hypothetical protein
MPFPPINATTLLTNEGGRFLARSLCALIVQDLAAARCVLLSAMPSATVEMVWADVTEVAYAGYLRQNPNPWTDPFIVGDGQVQWSGTICTFHNGTGGDIPLAGHATIFPGVGGDLLLWFCEYGDPTVIPDGQDFMVPLAGRLKFPLF